MCINVNVCFLVTIQTHMLAADLEGTALRIGCENKNSTALLTHENGGWVLSQGNYFFFHTNYCNVGTIEIYLVAEIREHGHGHEKLELIITFI